MPFHNSKVGIYFNVTGIVAGTQPVRFNPVMVVDPARSTMPVHSSFVTEGKQIKQCCIQKCKYYKVKNKMFSFTEFVIYFSSVFPHKCMIICFIIIK
jgi:hypothetical protein